MRTLYVGSIVGTAALVAALFVTAISAAWTGSGRLGGVAFVLFLSSALAVGSVSIWGIDAPARQLPRADRRRLREHERAARLQAEIERVDRELGLGR